MHALEDQALDRGHLAPVALVGLHHQLDARIVADELVGTEPDGVLLEAVVAHLLDVLLGHDPAGPGHHGAVEGHEVRPRLVQDEAHPGRSHHDDLAHFLVQDLRALGAVEAELHVLGGEGVAVVELQPLAQLELVGLLVRADGPRLGQAGGHEIARHRLDQRVVQRVQDPERCELPGDLGGVEPQRRQRDVERPAHLAFGFGLGGDLVRTGAREQGAEEQHTTEGEASSATHRYAP